MLQIKQLQVGIINELDLDIQSSVITALCGHSGSGKTTLLNAIAGYRDYQGHIFMNGVNIDRLHPWQRPCRYLNQRLYLFPHLTVLGNLYLAQYAAKQSKNDDECTEILTQVGVAHLAERYPWQISGGEQQRVALARVLISHPRLLLLDEPFSSLDWQLRVNLWQLVIDLQIQYSMTILLVTHEPKEAHMLANHIYHLKQGKLFAE